MHRRSYCAPIVGALLFGAIVFLACCPKSAFAQGYFGKNKITYDHRDWRELRTEHAEIYFYPEEEGLARQVAAIAESTCIELDATFRMRPRNRIPILFYSSHQAFQQSNAAMGFIGEGTGGLTELIKGRVLIPHTGSHHRLVWVTRHELVHAYMLEKIAQIGKKTKKYRLFYPPLWFTEGLAEFLSTTWDSQAEGLLQDAMVTGEALPLTRSESITGTVLMYKEGQSFLEYIAENYGGRSRVLDMFEHWHEGEDFEKVFEITFGQTLEEVDQAWYTAMRRRYYPRIETRRPVAEIARRLTCCDDAYNVAPCVLKNAPGDSTLRFAYLRAEEGAVDLRLRVERKGKVISDERILRSGYSARFESFHFFRSRLGASHDDRLALVSQDGGADVLHIVDLAEKKVLQTWSFPGIVGLASPTWVVGDSAIVLVGQAVSGHTDLYSVRVTDGAITQLTNDSSDEDDPVAHPTKSMIAFVSDREGGVEGKAHLFTYDLASGAIAQVTSGTHNERRPEWSPDGQRLAFISDREGIDDLFLWEEGKVQRASRFLGPITDPSWRPDGKALLFAGQSGWSYHVYEVPLAPVDSLWIAEPVDASRNGVPVATFADEPAERYRPRYSLDLAQSIVSVDPSSGASGGGGGGMVALSDVLGNQGYHLFLSNDASSFSGLLDGMELGVTYFNRAQRMNYGFGVFRLTRAYDADFDVVRRERRVGVTGLASYPISKFERIEASSVLRYSQGHYLRSGDFQDLWLLSNYLSIVHDDARNTPWGPASGTRMNLTGGFTRDLSTGQGDYLSLSAEMRKYMPLAREVVWANRAAVQASFGDNRENFYLGGSSALRAYPRRVMWGPKAMIVQTELRFPVMRGMRLGFPLPIQFPRVNATLSAEMATAGDSGDRFARLGTVGAGFYVGGGWFPLLRLDFLKRTDLKRIEAQTYTRFTMGYLF